MTEKIYEDIEQEFWGYEKAGDFIAGTYLGMRTGVGENKANLYTLRTPAGVISIWGSTVLDTKLPFINENDDIKIIYLGEKTGRGSRKYKDFKIQIAKPQETELNPGLQ